MGNSAPRQQRPFDRRPAPAADATLLLQRAIFSVQRAQRRGHELQLQVGDVLKRWTVPDGLSFDPAVRRLAVQGDDDRVPDEDDARARSRDPGAPAVFDHGVWSTRDDAAGQLAEGHLRFELFGDRLRGGWSLIRTDATASAPRWVLVKQRDPFAGRFDAGDLLDEHEHPPGVAAPAPLAAGFVASIAAARHAVPATIGSEPFAPQLAGVAERPPTGDGWLHEVKWDGYRLLATIRNGQPRLWSRNAIEWTARLPDIVDALVALGVDAARLDGELIVVRDGRSDFGALQGTLSGELHRPLVYMLFDLAHLQGYDLSGTPQTERKALLDALLTRNRSPHLQYSTHLHGHGDEAFDAASEQGLEGIVSKRADAGYRAGRGEHWLKIKRHDSDEFAVVGYTAPKGARSGFGSLLLARPDDDGQWRYVGRVGSGFSDRLLRRLAEELEQHGRPTPTVRTAGIDPALRDARWVEPARVVEVRYRGTGRLGLLRQPTLKAVRADRHADDLRGGGLPAARPPPKTLDQRPTVAISHPERIVYPDRGITKRQVVEYYRSVLPWLLPELIGRPLSIVRCPSGIAEPCFFQKHMTAGLRRVSSARLKEDSGRAGEYLHIENAEALLELVQFGAIELHPWGATVARPDAADRVVFDLDPAPGVAWKRLIAAARQVRALLGQAGFASFLRATGGKGLHVVVPLKPAADWPTVKRFARAVAEALATGHPHEYVASASKQLRDGRIFVDYLRNSRGATAIASYSLRARPGAPVAVPLRWNELARLERADRFTIDNVPRRLARLDADPWEGIADIEQDLHELAGRLGMPH